VDGGATKNNFLMQFQADMLQSKVVRAEIEEISALGSTLLAGMAIGWWKDKSEIMSLMQAGKTFMPQLSGATIDQLYTGWKSAVARARLKNEV
jgi:glycerol kinase